MLTKLRYLSFVPLVLMSLVALLVSTTTSASASCNPNRTNDGVGYLDGWISPSDGSAEATANSSNIGNYPHPYVTPGNGVFAWVMLNGSNSNEYAQVGWVSDSTGRHTFTEWDDNGTVGSDFSITPQAQGTTSSYEVSTYNGGNNDVYCFFVNGSEVGGCTSIQVWGAGYGESFGEIHTASDQMPGGTSKNNSEQWTNDFMFYNNHQSNFNGTGDNYSKAWFNLAIYSPTQADINDKSCST